MTIEKYNKKLKKKHRVEIKAIEMKVLSVSESGSENSATIQSESIDDSKKISTEVQDLLKAHNDDKTEKWVSIFSTAASNFIWFYFTILVDYFTIYIHRKPKSLFLYVFYTLCRIMLIE